MTNHTQKIAVTVPARTLRQVEAARRRLNRSRSSVVTEALETWLAQRSSATSDREYLAGYERFPEPEEAALAVAIVSSWDAWEPSPARRPRASTHRRASVGEKQRS